MAVWVTIRSQFFPAFEGKQALTCSTLNRLDFILKELNFDGGFNYKSEKPLDALQRLAPDGIDIYYENVS